MLDRIPALETKECTKCKESKPKLLDFSAKGRMCRECVSKQNKISRQKEKRDPKLKWRRFKIFLAALFMVSQGEHTLE